MDFGACLLFLYRLNWPQPVIHCRGGALMDQPRVFDPISESYRHAETFAERWKSSNVGAIDVLLILQIVAAACQLRTILANLFLGKEAAKARSLKSIRQAVDAHFSDRPAAFRESFAAELNEYVFDLRDGGLSREQTMQLLKQLQQ
jgi:hypothetical protein